MHERTTVEELHYHPKLLNLFSKEELDKIIACSTFSVNEEGFVDVIIVFTDKVTAEIYTDCEAQNLDIALIDNLGIPISELPIKLSKEKFLEVFSTATYGPPNCVWVEM